MRIPLVLQLHVIRIRPMKVRSLGAIAVHGCSVKANEFLSREQAYRLSVVRRLYNSCLQLAYTIWSGTVLQFLAVHCQRPVD